MYKQRVRTFISSKWIYNLQLVGVRRKSK